MPTKRRVDKARRHRISAEAVACYQAGDCCALHRALSLRPWEASPLRVDQGPPPGPTAYAASWAKDCNALHRALSLRPWKASQLRVDQGPPPGGPTAYAASWPQAQQLQRELEAALCGAQQAVHAAPDLPAAPAD